MFIFHNFWEHDLSGHNVSQVGIAFAPFTILYVDHLILNITAEPQYIRVVVTNELRENERAHTTYQSVYSMPPVTSDLC